MKYLAHRLKDLSDAPITINDVKIGRENDPINWEEGKIYYSLWYGTPMRAVVNSKTKAPHFAFNSNTVSDEEKEGSKESMEHQFSKQIIASLKCLHIQVYGKEYELPIKNALIENPVKFKNRQFRIDVFIKIEPCSFSEEYKSTDVAVELIKTCRVKSVKKKYLDDLDIPIIQINIFDKIDISGDSWEKGMNRLQGYWEKKRQAYVINRKGNSKPIPKHNNKINLPVSILSSSHNTSLQIEKEDVSRAILAPKDVKQETTQLNKRKEDDSPIATNISIQNEESIQFHPLWILILGIIVVTLLLFFFY